MKVPRWLRSHSTTALVRLPRLHIFPLQLLNTTTVSAQPPITDQDVVARSAHYMLALPAMSRPAPWPGAPKSIMIPPTVGTELSPRKILLICVLLPPTSRQAGQFGTFSCMATKVISAVCSWGSTMPFYQNSIIPHHLLRYATSE